MDGWRLPRGLPTTFGFRVETFAKIDNRRTGVARRVRPPRIFPIIRVPKSRLELFGGRPLFARLELKKKNAGESDAGRYAVSRNFFNITARESKSGWLRLRVMEFKVCQLGDLDKFHFLSYVCKMDISGIYI